LFAALYLAIVYARENWRNVMPAGSLADWGITPKRISAPKEPNPSLLRYVIKRVRNSLAHGSPQIDIPAGTTAADLPSDVTVTFKDVNTRNPADTFELILTLHDAFLLAKKFHEAVFDHVTKKYAVEVPAKP
jgi:hypothetical protein